MQPRSVKRLLANRGETGRPGKLQRFMIMSDSTCGERRLIKRVEQYWNSLRQSRAFPRTADIDPVALGDDWCDCFVLNPCERPEDSMFLFIGPTLLASAGLPADWTRTAARHLHDCPEDSVLGRAVRHAATVVRQQVPATVSEVFEENGVEVRLRCTLFPLSSDGHDIDAVLGAANCARLGDADAEQPAV